MLTRAASHLGSSSAAIGLSSSGSVSLPLVMECAHLGTLAAARASACLGTAVFALGRATPALPLSIQSSAWVEPAAFAFDFLKPDLVPPLRSFQCSDFLLPVTKNLCCEPSLPVLDSAHMGAFSTLRSCGHLDSALSVVEPASLGSPMLLKSMAQPGTSTAAYGTYRTGLLSLLPVADFLHPDLLLPAQSMSRPDPAISALNYMNAGFVSPAQTSVRAGSPASVMGLTCSGLLFSLSAAELCHLEALSFAKTFARVGFVASVLQFSNLGSVVPSRSYYHVGPFASVSGQLRLDFALFLLGMVELDLLLFPQSLVRLDLSPFALNRVNVEPVLSLQSPA